MKKYLLLLVAALGMTLSASAQKTEIQVGYGGYTQMDACDCHDGWSHVNTAWGAVTAGVNFKVTPKMWLGPTYTFSSTKTDGGKYASKIAYHAIMLNGRYEYYRTSKVTVYAHLGLGAVVSHMQPHGGDSYNCTYFAFQISPVGAQMSLSRNASIFGELGFGAQGLLQVGFRFNI